MPGGRRAASLCHISVPAPPLEAAGEVGHTRVPTPSGASSLSVCLRVFLLWLILGFSSAQVSCGAVALTAIQGVNGSPLAAPCERSFWAAEAVAEAVGEAVAEAVVSLGRPLNLPPENTTPATAPPPPFALKKNKHAAPSRSNICCGRFVAPQEATPHYTVREKIVRPQMGSTLVMLEAVRPGAEGSAYKQHSASGGRSC